MRKNRSVIGLLVLAAFVSCSAFSCSQQKTAQQVLNKVAVTNQAFERGVRAAHHDLDASGNPFVDDNLERSLLDISRKVAVAGNEASTAFLAGDNATTLERINLSIALIDDANTNRLLGINDPKKREELSALLLAVRGLFTTAKGFIPGGGL